MNYRPRGEDNEKLVNDLQGFGVDVDELGDEEDDSFPVLRRNWLAVREFLKLQTRWKAGLEGLTGFDVGAIEFEIRMGRIKMNNTRWQNLVIMEHEVLRVIKEER